MSAGLPADLVDEVTERATRRLVDMAVEVTDRQMRPDGTTYGDSDLDRGQRILRILDYADRGVLDAMRIVKPPLLERWIKQFEHDIQGTPFYSQPAAQDVVAQYGTPQTGGY